MVSSPPSTSINLGEEKIKQYVPDESFPSPKTVHVIRLNSQIFSNQLEGYLLRKIKL